MIICPSGKHHSSLCASILTPRTEDSLLLASALLHVVQGYYFTGFLVNLEYNYSEEIRL